MTGKAIGDLVRKLADGTGKQISPHKLRAAFATNVYEQTHDIMFTMTAMHHSSPTITQRYVVQKSDAVERAEKIMEDILRR
jgi:integrase